MHVLSNNRTISVFLTVVLCSILGCNSEPPFWKDVTHSQAINFLDAQGITARNLVIGNAGEFELDLEGTTITNLDVLEGMPIASLNLSRTPVHDLRPLREMRFLRKLNVASTDVSDLSPLEGLQLIDLSISNTQVADLRPLQNMPLQVISLGQTKVHDLTPIEHLALREIYFSADESLSDQSIKMLRQKDSLHCINYYGNVEDFWADYDAGKFKPKSSSKSR